MIEGQEDGSRRPRVQRHLRHPQAAEQRRRLQLGTGYPHRGPAPACSQPQRTYRPGEPAAAGRSGRLRVFNRPAGDEA